MHPSSQGQRPRPVRCLLLRPMAAPELRLPTRASMPMATPMATRTRVGWIRADRIQAGRTAGSAPSLVPRLKLPALANQARAAVVVDAAVVAGGVDLTAAAPQAARPPVPKAEAAADGPEVPIERAMGAPRDRVAGS